MTTLQSPHNDNPTNCLLYFSANVMYDRPPEMFKETSVNDRHKLFVKLAEKYDVFRPA